MNDRSQVSPLIFTLIGTARVLEGKLEAALEGSHLSLAKFGVLEILARSGSPVALSELADKTGCVRSNITQLIDRMEAEALVRRIPDVADRRMIRAELSPLGQERYALGSAAMDETQAVCLAVLPEGDRAALNWALKRLQ